MYLFIHTTIQKVIKNKQTNNNTKCWSACLLGLIIIYTIIHIVSCHQIIHDQKFSEAKSTLNNLLDFFTQSTNVTMKVESIFKLNSVVDCDVQLNRCSEQT